tara:strand:+ start:817 stop:3189 length:2373 start_codon:yes stop_codon:yes gene_type:complete
MKNISLLSIALLVGVAKAFTLRGSNNPSKWDDIINDYIKPEIQNQDNIIHNSHSKVVHRLVTDGFATLEGSERIMQLSSLPPHGVDAVIDHLNDTAMPVIPGAEILNWNFALNIVKKMSFDDNDDSFIFSSVGCNDGVCSQAMLIAKPVSKSKPKLIDVINVMAKMEFKEAPDIVVVRTTDVDKITGKTTKTDHIVDKPKDVDDDEMEGIFAVFQKASLNKVLESLKNPMDIISFLDDMNDDPKPPSMPNADPKKDPDTDKRNKDDTNNNLGECAKDVAAGTVIAGPTGGAMGAMTCLWKDIAAAFGSSSSSTIQKEICNDGFSKFDMTQPVMYYPKLPYMAHSLSDPDVVVHPVNEFCDLILNVHMKDVPETGNVSRADYAFYLKMLATGYGLGNNVTSAVADTSIHYVDKSGGNLDMHKLLARPVIIEDSPEKSYAEVIYIQTHVSMKLAPRLFVWRTSNSVLGGIWSHTEDQIREIPRAITLQDISMMADFCNMFALNQISFTMGLCSAGSNFSGCALPQLPNPQMSSKYVAPTLVCEYSDNLGCVAECIAEGYQYGGYCNDNNICHCNSDWNVIQNMRVSPSPLNKDILHERSIQLQASIQERIGSESINDKITSIVGNGMKKFKESAGLVSFDYGSMTNIQTLAETIAKIIGTSDKDVISDIVLNLEYPPMKDNAVTDTEGSVYVYTKYGFHATDTGTPGAVKYSSILSTMNPDGKNANVQVFYLDDSFEIAPDIVYLQHCSSAIFGLSKSCDTIPKSIPHDLTEIDMLLLMDWFEMHALKELGK